MENNLKNNYRFLAILEQGDNSVGVYFPDLDGCITGGDNIDEAIECAYEVLKLHLYGMEEDNEAIPEPSSITDLTLEKNESPIMIDVYMKPFREKMNEKFIKKTLSIPNWMNTMAEEKGINFSKLLQNAISHELNIR